MSSASASPPPVSIFAARYRAERLLGKGGMGEVYAVLDESSGRRLALKYLRAGAAERQETAFRREYQTLALLRHPHIVEVYDYVAEPSGAFYTMELLSGSDLSTRAPLPWRDVCRVLRDVASILLLLHSRRLVHRDLSPRNIWCLPDGRIKLIDFGALTSFGAANDVVGTPPFLPPEALRDRSLDQRSDLFALGALAYWLIGGVHAFPARSFAELPTLWLSTPGPVSRQLARAGRDDTPPPELDLLIEALLHDDPTLRPQSAAGLIDQLTAIAGLTPELGPGAGLALLRSPQLTARGQELARVVLTLRRAERGQGRALLIEAPAGLGRTRLLHELAVSAQLVGVTALSAGAAHGAAPFAVANALSLRLLETLPGVAREAAQPHLAELADLSDQLAAQLGAERGAQPGGDAAPFEQRMRVSGALTEWFLAVCERRTLALFVDDVQRIDHESQAFLTGLAHQARAHRLTLVTSLPSESIATLSIPLQTLRKVSKRVQLKPLTSVESTALLASIFGNASYLSRLSERLYQATLGNPAHCLLLLEQLVQSGVIDYREG
ncbi:MAG TPA: serine/threonine-protein kinase, partial [Polyangiales bacterium]